jgi:hypothetical protein
MMHAPLGKPGAAGIADCAATVAAQERIQHGHS